MSLSACRADVRVQVALTPTGSGTVSARVVLDRQAAAVVGAGIDLGDLRRDGWQVTGPTPAGDGSQTISVSHPFADAGQATALLGRLGGPVHLTVLHHGGTVSSSVGVRGTIDLRGGLDALAGATPTLPGGLGPALAVVAKAGGTVPTVTVAFAAALPGSPGGVHGGATVAGDVVTWTAPLGAVTTVAVAASRTDTTAERWLAAAAALLVVLVALGVVEVVRARRAPG